ncbi:MAG TPA: hypothetical protein VIK89_04515 [Cytophagaceae bacterium]
MQVDHKPLVPFLSLSKTAEALDCSTRQIYNLIDKGILKPYYLKGSIKPYFFIQDIVDSMEEKKGGDQ